MNKSLLFGLLAACSLSAAATTYNVTLNPASVYRNNGTNAYFSQVNGTDGNYVKLSNAYNNMSLSDGVLSIYKGGSVADYILSGLHPAMTVTGFSITLKNASANANIVANGITTAITAEGVTVNGTGDRFALSGSNSANVIENLTVTFETSENVINGIPAETGWYEIWNLNCGSTTAYVGQQVVNMEDEYNQSSSNKYSLGVANPLPKPAVGYIYVEVDGNNRYLQSANGHYINNNTTSSLTRESTNFADAANGTVKIGGYWNAFTTGGTNKVGSGSSASANQWAVIKANPEASYDIWSVTILNGTKTGELDSHTRVECTSSVNQGIAKVYDGGKFFITKGAELSSIDFSADAVGDNHAPKIIVDNEAKTVTIDYNADPDADEYLAGIYQLIENKYHNAKVLEVYGEQVDNAIDSLKALARSAAGNNATINSEVADAIDAAINLDATYAADLIKFNKSLNGQYVRIRNYKYDSFLCTQPNDNTKGGTSVNGNDRPTTIWKIDTNEQGQIRLQNYVTKAYIGNTTATETVVSLDETGYYFTVSPNTYAGNPAFEIYDQETSGAHYLHAGTQGSYSDHRLLKWNTFSNSDASGWLISKIDVPEEVVGTTGDEDEEVVDAETKFDTEAAAHTITIAHPTESLSKHPVYFYDATKVITITTFVRSGETITLTHANCTESDGKIIVNVGQQLAAGNYTVNVPEGMFKVGENKMNNAILSTIEVADNGTTTSIAEIETAKPAVQAVFDLQGRRLASPVKGINIINGKKVLVK